MTADIVPLPIAAPLEPEDVLEEAKSWKLTEVIVMGYDEAGSFVWGCSSDDNAGINLLIDQAKREHLSDMFDWEE